MLFPIINPHDWAETYSLEIKRVACTKCEDIFMRNIPFATKGYRGLMTKEHACGLSYVSSIAKPTGESLKLIRLALFG